MERDERGTGLSPRDQPPARGSRPTADLVVALAELAAEIQRCRTAEAVLDTAAAGLLLRNMRLAVLRISGDDLVVHHVDDHPDAMAAFERSLGRPLRGLVLPIPTLGAVRDVLAARRARYVENLWEVVASSLEAAGLEPDVVARLASIFGARRALLSPLHVADRPWGILAVASEDLEPADVDAVALFAAQLGAALEVAQTFEELERTGQEQRRHAALVAALSEIAATLRTCRTVDAVLDTAAVGLLDLDLRLSVLRVDEGDLVLSYVGRHLESIEVAERIIERPLKGLRIPASAMETARNLLDGRKAIYLESVEAVTAGFMSRAGLHAEVASEVASIRGAGKALFSPLHVQGRPWGILVLTADELSQKDADAVALFAVQVGSAIEVAQTFEELERANAEQRRSSDLLAALSAIGTRVQTSRTTASVLETAAEGLRGRGMQLTAMRLVDDRLVVRRAGLSPEQKEPIEAAIGRPMEGLSIPLSEAKHIAPVLASRRVVFSHELGEATVRFFARSFDGEGGAVGAMASSASGSRGILVPLYVGDRPWGALAVTSPDLAQADVAALSLFAAQVASALEVAETLEEMERANRELTALATLAKTGSEENLVGVLPRILEVVATATESDCAAIGFLDEENAELVRGGYFPGPDSFSERYERIPLSQSVLAEGTKSARALNVEGWPSFSRAQARAEGFLEFAVVPLLAKGRFVGTLDLGRKGPRPYGPADLAAAEKIAAQLAIQVENARLLEDAQSRVHDLSRLNEFSAAVSTPVDLDARLEAGVWYLERLVEAPNVFVMLPDPSGSSLRVVATNVVEPDGRTLSIPMDDTSVATTAFHAREPIIVDDAQEDPRAAKAIARVFGHRALLGLPLVAREQAVGAVVLGDTRVGRRFTRSQVYRAEAVANQLAVAVENARLLADARRRVDELRLLLDVGRAITGTLDPEAILETSATALRRIVEASAAFVFILDAEKRYLVGRATSDPALRDQFRTVRISLDGEAIASRCVRAREPLMAPDVDGTDDSDRGLAALQALRSLVAIPLLLRDEAVGAVVIGDVRGPRDWTGAEVELATLVCQQIAVAVANARLYDDLRRSYRDLGRAQEELVKRERLAALGELAAVVAHEVRNPLGVIFNSIVSLRKILKPEGDAAMLLSIVGEEADRLNRMVGNLLGFARPNVPALEMGSLAGVVEEAVVAAKREASAPAVEVVVRLSDDLGSVPLDVHLVRQALLNVVLNGLQAMPSGGTLTVRARRAQRGPRTWALVEVSDTGPGIPESIQDQIFLPFFTTKASGTGLGLAVVKRIVEAHHGQVTVSSVPGGGTTFTLLLPLEEVP